jgi:hypothetical protein
VALITVEIWIVLSAALSAGGWVLSYFHLFNGSGFTIIVCLSFFWAFFYYRRQNVDWRKLWRKERLRLNREIKKVFPFLFYLLAGMSLAAGLLYRPLHLDAIEYRIPRLLHWAGEQSWHWIITPDIRMNAAAPGGEFLLAPFLFWTKTERFFFLYNWISFLWLPGLIFSVFLKLGVRPRVAWHWMWLLPTGYCYVMQASSLGNDSYGAVYALAAIDFALRARKSGKLKDLFLSMLAVATLTGAKQTNAIVGLPWLVAFAPNWRLLFRRPVLTGMILLLSLWASLVPISLMNLKYAGTWKGFTGVHAFIPRSPFWGIIGNLIALPAQNFQPPICPWIHQWNEMMREFRESEFGRHFEGFEFLGNLARSPSDQVAGLGFITSLVVMISFLGGMSAAAKGHSPMPLRRKALHAASWLALLVGMAKLGSTQNARYLAPLYPLLTATLIAGGGQERVIRQRWWRMFCIAGTISTVLVVIISRQRPLWPAVTMTTYLAERFPENVLARKLRNAFVFFPKIRAAHSYMKDHIPKEEKFVGYMADLGTLEIPLWKPLWTRRVFRLTRLDTLESMRRKGIKYVVLDPSAFRPTRYTLLSKNWGGIDKWLEEIPSEVVGETEVPLDPQLPSFSAYIVRLEDEKKGGTRMDGSQSEGKR